jgi:uncharacterized protein YkwD
MFGRALAKALSRMSAVVVLVLGLGAGAMQFSAPQTAAPRTAAQHSLRADPIIVPVASSYGPIDTSSRTSVQSAYLSQFALGSSTMPEWTGETGSCTGGTTSTAYVGDVLSALNYVRGLAGLAPVTVSARLSTEAQQAALIMDANRAVSHAPPTTWRCWSPAGARAAGNSNLLLSIPGASAAQAISLYMDEPGTTNDAVGHRRWLLFPETTAVGIGATSSSNAIWVMGPTSKNRSNPAWVGWPNQGWFPTPLVPGVRWSLSAGNPQMRFAHAVVRVYHNGLRVPVHAYRPDAGYGRPTIAWAMPAGFGRSGSYRVVVNKITKVGTSKQFRHDYWVHLFDPGSE